MEFAGLPSSPWYERAQRLSAGRGAGSVPAFVIKGGVDAGKRFVEGLSCTATWPTSATFGAW